MNSSPIRLTNPEGDEELALKNKTIAGCSPITCNIPTTHKSSFPFYFLVLNKTLSPHSFKFILS